MQSKLSTFVGSLEKGSSRAERFQEIQYWAEFSLRLFTLLCLLVPLSLIALAVVAVAIGALAVLASGEVGHAAIIASILLALLVRAIGHVGRLVAVSLKSILTTPDALHPGHVDTHL